MLPSSFTAWQGVVAGAFLAFFAFIGFESLANMAEEAKDPRRTVPYSIVGAVVISTLLYVLVAAALVFAGRDGQSPLSTCSKARMRRCSPRLARWLSPTASWSRS
jgi:basic amino acid/polyamine antiporter, APA family